MSQPFRFYLPADSLNVPVRLEGGPTARKGRLMVSRNGTAGPYGSVCDDGFGVPEAKVVCEQLGFHG